MQTSHYRVQFEPTHQPAAFSGKISASNRKKSEKSLNTSGDLIATRILLQYVCIYGAVLCFTKRSLQ